MSVVVKTSYYVVQAHCQRLTLLLPVLPVQEKIDVLNERLEAANMAAGAAKEDASDSLDSMQAWKQSVKKCM